MYELCKRLKINAVLVSEHLVKNIDFNISKLKYSFIRRYVSEMGGC